MLILSLFFQVETNYEDIPRYGLTKEFIRDECQRVLHHYDRTAYTKLIRVFFEILFETRLCVYCSASGIDKTSAIGDVARPGLDIRKRQAIHAITRMAGFNKSFSQFNGAMNNVLNTIRKEMKISSSSYDGKYKSRILRYNDDEEIAAQDRERKYYESH